LLDDAVVHLEELAKLSARPVSVLGHSLGGQLATMGLAAWHRPGAKVVVIASGTVHSTAWKGLAAFGVYAGTQLAGAVARGLGYFPGHRLGFGGLQGRTLIVDWARAAKTGHFGEIERELERFTPEVLAIHVEGDTMAPRSASTAATTASACPVERTSSIAKLALPPVPTICATTAWPSASSMSVTTTCQPARAKASAVARPMPMPPPVTSRVRGGDMGPGSCRM
jgi:predicted alpha/beta hydrolase